MRHLSVDFRKFLFFLSLHLLSISLQHNIVSVLRHNNVTSFDAFFIEIPVVVLLFNGKLSFVFFLFSVSILQLLFAYFLYMNLVFDALLLHGGIWVILKRSEATRMLNAIYICHEWKQKRVYTIHISSMFVLCWSLISLMTLADLTWFLTRREMKVKFLDDDGQETTTESANSKSQSYKG